MSGWATAGIIAATVYVLGTLLAWKLCGELWVAALWPIWPLGWLLMGIGSNKG